MWLVIRAFIKTNALKIAGYVAVAFSVLGIAFGIRQSGKNAARVDALEKQAKNVGKSHDIEDKNRANLRDGDAANRLRDKWSRD